MENNFNPTEKKNSEFNQVKQSNDYKFLLERFKSIKKAIALLENILIK